MGPRGRPRTFDREEALRRAMTLFWTRGYEGSSVDELAQAMGVNKPSLYAAFGCKEQLFREAIACYERIEGEPVRKAMREARTAREAIESMLRINARAFASPRRPRGCMVVMSAFPDAPDNETLREFLSQMRKASLDEATGRIERGMHDGDVPAGADALAMAAFYNTVLQGLSIQSRDGASRKEMERIVDSAMAAWDTLAASGGRD